MYYKSVYYMYNCTYYMFRQMSLSLMLLKNKDETVKDTPKRMIERREREKER